MMIRSIAVSAWCLAALAASAQDDATHPDRFLVSPSWLQSRMNDRALILLQVGKREEYDSAHVPGARFIQTSDISVTRDGLSLELPPVAALDSMLETFGINDSSTIVVYFGNDWVSPATRVLFTLEYAGLQPYFLDGGLPAWKEAGGAVTNRLPQVHRGSLSRHHPRNLTVSGDWVRANMGKRGVAIVDSRSKDYYDGSNDGRGRIKRPGHIPGAKNISFDSVVLETNQLKSSDALRTLFENAGIRAGDTVVTYCHIGQQATLVLTAARRLGYNVKLYDGSFQEWCMHDDFPVAAGSHPDGDH